MDKAKVELAVTDWETVLNALGELTYKVAAPVFAAITTQVRAQIGAENAKAEQARGTK